MNYRGGVGAADFSHTLPHVRWKLEKENNTDNLIGRAYVNGSRNDPMTQHVHTHQHDDDDDDADDHTPSELFLRVEFHSGDPSQGRFQSGYDEDSLPTLFRFAFHQHRASIPISAGIWNGDEMQGEKDDKTKNNDGATYVFQASAPDRFTITVTPRSFDLLKASKPQPAAGDKKATKKHSDDDDDELSSASGPATTGYPLLPASELASQESIIYIGHRIKSEAEKTFMQKYGTMILLGGMLLLNVYMRTKQSGTQLTKKQAPAMQELMAHKAAQKAAAAAAKASAGGGAKIELLDDSVTTNSSTGGDEGTKKEQ